MVASSAETSAAQTSQVTDVANNVAPAGDIAGGLYNFNLTGLSLKGTGSKTKSRSGDTGGLGGGKSGKSAADSSGSNSGVQFNILDQGAIGKAFAFVENVVKGAFTANEQSIKGVLSANERAVTKPSDTSDRYVIIGAVVVLVIYFIWGRK